MLEAGFLRGVVPYSIPLVFIISLLLKLRGDNVTVNAKKSLVGNRMGSKLFFVLFVGWLGTLVFLPHRKTYFS